MPCHVYCMWLYSRFFFNSNSAFTNFVTLLVTRTNFPVSFSLSLLLPPHSFPFPRPSCTKILQNTNQRCRNTSDSWNLALSIYHSRILPRPLPLPFPPSSFHSLSLSLPLPLPRFSNHRTFFTNLCHICLNLIVKTISRIRQQIRD